MIPDMDLFRRVLIEIEQIPPGQWKRIEIQGEAPEAIKYHAQLDDDAGLIEARFMGNSTTEFAARRLTYSGHEFLDAARNDTLWAKAKKKALDSTGVLTVEGLKLALPEVVKAALHHL